MGLKRFAGAQWKTWGGLAVGATLVAAMVPGLGALGAPLPMANTHLPARPTPAPSTAAAIPRSMAGLTTALTKVQQLEAKVKQAQAEIERVSATAAMATEKYNAAKVALQRRQTEARAATKRALRTSQMEERSRSQMHQWAASVYMQGGTLDGLEVLLVPNGTTNVTDRVEGADVVAGYRKRTAEDATSARKEAHEAKRESTMAELRAKAAAAVAQKAYQVARAQVAAAAARSMQVKAEQALVVGQMATLRGTTVAVEYTRIAGMTDAESKALWEKNKASLEQKLGIKINTYPTADTAAAAMAIEFARAQIGEPYLWGGEGPNAWDCSGLTQAAWRTSGRALSHYTGSQWQETKLVPLKDAKPGDLVFYGQAPGNIHHVGLFIGNGQMIEAPRTGLNVRIAPIYRGDLIPYVGRP